VAIVAILIIGAASAIWHFYVQSKIPVDNTPDQSGESVLVASDEKKALEAKKRREEELKIEMEKERIAAEQKRIEEERKAFEAKKRQKEELKLEMEKERISAERKRIEEEKRALEAKKRREEERSIEMEKQRIADERKRIEEEKRAFEAQKRQEEARKKQLAYAPKAVSKSPDDGIVYNKPEGDSRRSLAVFPFCESAIRNINVIEQKEFIDFMIKFTKNIPNILFTHSFYPYHKYRTDHQLRLINSLIHEGLEKEIWYGNSSFPRKKPDHSVLKRLAKKIHSDLILTFKIVSVPTHPVELYVIYYGYLIDIEKNIDYEKTHRQYYNERTIGFADFNILKQMTRDLFELYLSSNPQTPK
jgi:hypothetical protein